MKNSKHDFIAPSKKKRTIWFLNIILGVLKKEKRKKISTSQNVGQLVQMTSAWQVWFGTAPIFPFERQMELRERQPEEDIFMSFKSEAKLQGLVGKLQILRLWEFFK